MNRQMTWTALALVAATALTGCSKKSEGPMAETTSQTPTPTGSQIIAPAPTAWDRSVMPTPEPSGKPSYRVNEITFASGTTQSGPEGQGVCREVAATLTAKNVRKILLIGFMDMSETDGTLPMKRAESIRSCLVANGLKAEQIELASYGSSMARGDKQQPAQMEIDRRVEIWVLSE